MGCKLQFFAFVFLVLAVGVEIASFTSSYMVQGTLNTNDREGIFLRCLPIRGCRWWNSGSFRYDPKWLQGVVILSILSGATLALVGLFSLIAFIPKCRSRNINIFNGVLLLFNSILLSAIITIYTTLNDKSVQFSGGLLYNFSWSYWLLYGAIGLNVLTSVLFCCNTATTGKYKYEY